MRPPQAFLYTTHLSLFSILDNPYISYIINYLIEIGPLDYIIIEIKVSIIIISIIGIPTWIGVSRTSRTSVTGVLVNHYQRFSFPLYLPQFKARLHLRLCLRLRSLKSLPSQRCQCLNLNGAVKPILVILILQRVSLTGAR